MAHVELFAGSLYPSRKRILQVLFEYDDRKNVSVYHWSRQTGIADLSMPEEPFQILRAYQNHIWVSQDSEEERALALAAFRATDNQRGRNKMQSAFSSALCLAELRHRKCAPHKAAFRSACEVAKSVSVPEITSWSF